ncbi:MAG: flagellar hook-basal body complex protein FliE [Phycisphaeraceae bacterium]|nr:flagellar hook-basal body complex protein FliE [Phycisphaeraceae bacterium]
MTDPLGLIRGAGVGGAAGVGGPSPFRPQTSTPATTPDGASFKDVLMENLRQVNELQQEATTAIEDLSTGKRNDLEGVLLATQKADTAFRMMLAVKNKVAAAYDEIKQLRV